MTRLAVVLGILAAAGCGRHEAPAFDAPQVSFAGDFYLELWILGEDNLAVIYRVNGDRVLGWGGGRDAVSRRVSWTGVLDPQRYDRLRVLLEQEGWLAGGVESSGAPRKRITRVSLRWDGRSRRYSLRGECPAVEPLAALLDEACRKRLEPELESLPQAGEPVVP